MGIVFLTIGVFIVAVSVAGLIGFRRSDGDGEGGAKKAGGK